MSLDDSGRRWLERFLAAIIRIPAYSPGKTFETEGCFYDGKTEGKKINNFFVSRAYFWNSIYVFQLFGNNRHRRRLCHRFLDCWRVAPIRAERMQNSRIVDRRWTRENGFNRNMFYTSGKSTFLNACRAGSAVFKGYETQHIVQRKNG